MTTKKKKEVTVKSLQDIDVKPKAKVRKKPIIRVVKQRRSLACNLTQKEMLEAGKTLANKVNDRKNLENSKKQAMSDFAARDKVLVAEIAVLENKVRTGYEFKEVDCEVRFNSPKAGLKQLWRADTRKVEGEQKMSDEEIQQLPFPEVDERAKA